MDAVSEASTKSPTVPATVHEGFKWGLMGETTKPKGL